MRAHLFAYPLKLLVRGIMVRSGLTQETATPGTLIGNVRYRLTGAGLLTVVSSLLLAAPFVILVMLGYRQRWVSEDAYISLRVAEQILAGNGPVFNAGERIEAHTNPLWVAMLTFAGAIGADTVLATVFLGIVLSATGLFFALAGSMQLSGRLSLSEQESRYGLFLPAGALVFVTVPVVWDFVTSGLETGLGFGWLGISFWLLVRCGTTSPPLPRWQWYVSALVLGLGPLVRPDFAIFSAGFLLALAYLRFESLERHLMIRDFLMLVLSAAILPLGYQIFRMGYYAALVPNTALAKEAGETNWEQGKIYFSDFVDPYHLWVPVAIILTLSLLQLYSGFRQRDWSGIVLLTMPILTATLHALYVVRVGGDFMHGRMFLPALFAVMLPVAVVRVPISRGFLSFVTGTAVAGLVVWSMIAGTSLRNTLGYQVDEDTGLVDERAFYVEISDHQNPVTLDDYANGEIRWLENGQDARERVENGTHAVVIRGEELPISDDVPEKVRLVTPGGNIGMLGYSAGTSVHIVDRLGLADPLGSRVELEERGRPGHEKALPMIWVVARFTGLDVAEVDDPNFAHAREALQCGEIRELIEAVTAPLTPGRFLENIGSSWSFHNLRMPSDPAEARERFCD